jgi:hypothetical protein
MERIINLEMEYRKDNSDTFLAIGYNEDDSISLAVINDKDMDNEAYIERMDLTLQDLKDVVNDVESLVKAAQKAESNNA